MRIVYTGSTTDVRGMHGRMGGYTGRAGLQGTAGEDEKFQQGWVAAQLLGEDVDVWVRWFETATPKEAWDPELQALYNFDFAFNRSDNYRYRLPACCACSSR